MVAPLAQSPIVAILKLDRVFDESPSGIIFLLMSFGTSEYDPIAVYSFDLHRFVTLYGIFFLTVASSSCRIPFSELEIFQERLRP